jgi:hypothetical protein
MNSRKTLALAEFPLKRDVPPIVAHKARCHSKMLTAPAGMNCTRKKVAVGRLS